MDGESGCYKSYHVAPLLTNWTPQLKKEGREQGSYCLHSAVLKVLHKEGLFSL